MKVHHITREMGDASAEWSAGGNSFEITIDRLDLVDFVRDYDMAPAGYDPREYLDDYFEDVVSRYLLSQSIDYLLQNSAAA